MDDFVEHALTGVDYVVDKHGDKIYDKVSDTYHSSFGHRRRSSNAEGDRRKQSGSVAGASAVSGNTSRTAHRHRNSLPSPERDRETVYTQRPAANRNDSLERESQRSARVLREYEDEPDDPRRDPYQALGRDAIPPAAAAAASAVPPTPSAVSGRTGARRDVGRGDMSNVNGDAQRPRSQPPASKYNDDDSDYDERSGTRYRASGRGYDDDYRGRDTDVGEPYREYYETERYRGPARNFESQFKGPDTAPYGAVAPYRRRSSRVAQTELTRRSASRGRRDSRSRSRSRSYSGSRSRSRDSPKRKLEEWFDGTPRGIGFGIAGAVAGGLVGRELAGRKQSDHHRRDMVLGAVIGGLAVNAAEKKWQEYRHPEDNRRESKKDLAIYDYDDKRARSSVR